MSALPALSKIRPADRQNAIDNLRRETDAERQVCAECYDRAGGDFKKALAAIDAQVKAEIAEREAKRAQDAERDYQSQILELKYWQAIRPALRRWMQAETFDPMQNPSDAFSLWEELTRRGFLVEATPQGDLYSVRVCKASGQSWISGDGTGDNLREALVMAWWHTFGED
jgi:hypothetical protein